MYKNLQSLTISSSIVLQTIFLIFCGCYKSYAQTPDASGIVYVKKGSTGAGNSWASPIGELADALKAAKTNTNIKQIWVSKGVYYPLYSPQDGANFGTDKGRNNAFLLVKDVKVYGGFAGTENTLAQRNLNLNNTSILSGDFNGNDVVSGGGSTLTITGNTENAYHVVISSGDVGKALLDGFTITGGNADNTGSFKVNSKDITRSLGGGIYTYTSSPTFSNVVVCKNTAEIGGGILNLSGAQPIFTNALIYKNIATRTNMGGGGVYNGMVSRPVFYQTTIARNKADYGGAVYNYDGSQPSIAVFLNSVVYGNSSGIDAYNSMGSIPYYSRIYSLIQGDNTTSGGSISGNTNPKFNDTENDDYTLAEESPLIDKGNNQYIMANTDLAGNARIRNSRVDIGAYEVQTGNTMPYVKPATNDIVYVKKGGKGTGSSWDDAIGELADALLAAKVLNNEAAGTVKQIWVAHGVYKPMYSPADDNFGNPDERNNAFLLVKDVKVYGGFAGTETTLAQRNLNLKNTSVLSGDFNDNDVVSGTGSSLTISGNNENAFHVVVPQGGLIDGFTITGGNANGSGTVSINGNDVNKGQGGGFSFNNPSSFSGMNCIVTANAAIRGGGMLSNGTSTFINTLITKNLAYQVSSGGHGAGIYSSGTATFINTTVTGNKAVGQAGAAYTNANSTLNIYNSIVYDNAGSPAGISVHTTGGLLNCRYSLVQGQTSTANGNINGDTDPLFANAANDDYTLQTNSLVINAGNNALYEGLNASSKDIAGNARVYNGTDGTVDMGAYESPFSLAPAYTYSETITKTYGNADFDLEVTSTSDGTFTYTSGNDEVATINGKTVTIVGAGTTTITATQAETDNYKAGSIYLTLTVAKANPVLSGFADISKTYGDADFTLTAATSNSTGAFTYTSDNTSAATISGNTVSIKSAGTTKIKATQAETANYKSASIELTLTVDKANQSISFAPLDVKTTNDEDFVLIASTDSGLPLNYISSNTAVAEIYKDGGVWKVHIKSEGSTDITASQNGNGNYFAANDAVQPLTVVEAPLSVSLTSFTAKTDNNSAKLEWRTAFEKDNAKFVIYRSGDNRIFIKLEEIPASRISNLTSHIYSYTDQRPLNGNNYYKLIQIDLDGKETDLGTKQVTFSLQSSVLSLYPNPTADKVNIHFKRGIYNRLTVADLWGRILQQQLISKTVAETNIDLTTYPSGTYILSLQGKAGLERVKVIRK